MENSMEKLVNLLVALSILSVAWALLIVFKGDARQAQMLGGILFTALGGYLLLLAGFIKSHISGPGQPDAARQNRQINSM